jgi:hypothetical protein
MTTKRMALLLVLVGSLYLFSGLDMKRTQSSTEASATSWTANLPVFFPAKDKAQQRIWYGSLLLAAGGIFFVTGKKPRKSSMVK